MHGHEAGKSRVLFLAPVVAFWAGLLLLAAPSAMAQGCQTAPGKSGIDQYCEVVPDAGGGSNGSAGEDNQNAPSGGGGGSSGNTAPTDSATRTLNAAEADDGSDTARSRGEGKGKKGKRDRATVPAVRPADPSVFTADRPTPGSSPLGALSAVVSGPGSGSGVRFLLIALTLGLIGAGLWRRRANAGSDTP